jgi:hypothetical protein
MAQRNPNAPQAGFAAAPAFGFAAIGGGTRSYGSVVEQPGLAADLKAGLAMLQQEQEAAGDLSSITVIDETAQAAEEARHDTSVIKKIRRNRPQSAGGQTGGEESYPDIVSRETSLGIVIGRRVVVTKGSRWRGFESDLQDRSDAYVTVPYNRLTMPYFTEAETDRLLDQVITRAHRRNRRPVDERTIIGGFRQKLADDVADLVHLDRECEAIACDIEPQRDEDKAELAEFLDRIAYPDRHAFQTEDRSRPSDDVGIFTNATFLHKRLGSIGITTKTIMLEDYTGVNTVGRTKLLDMLVHKHSLNVSHISEEWDGPQIPIWHMVGRGTLAGFVYKMPETPLDITLGPAGVFKR